MTRRSSPPKHAGQETSPKGLRGKSRSLLHGFSWSFANQVLTAVSLIIVVPHLVHDLGLVQYGVYTLGLTGLLLLIQVDGGVINTSTRYFSVYVGEGNRDGITRFFLTNALVLIVFGCLVASVVGLEAGTIVRLFNIRSSLVSESEFYFRIVAALLPLVLLQGLANSLLNAYQRFRFISLCSIASIIGRTVALLVLVNPHSGLRVVGIIAFSQQALLSLMLLVPSVSHVVRGRAGLLAWKETKEVIRFGLYVQLTNVATLVNQQSDALLIGVLAPVREVGIYNTGASLASQARAVPQNAIFPAGTRLASTYGAKGAEATFDLFKQLQRQWVQAITGFFASVLASAYFGIPAWLGHSFQLGGTVCAILLAAYAINLYTVMLTLYANAVGQPEVEARFGLLAMVVNIAFTAALATLGTLGIVGATAVGTIGASLYLVRMARRRIRPDLPSFLRDVPWVAAVFAVATSVLVCLGLHGHVPHGFLGLVTYGVPAIPAGAVFLLVHLGPRACARFARRALSGQGFSLPL